MTKFPAIPSVLHRFTTADYHRMVEAGILTASDKVELLDGQISIMSPIGRFHAACVNRLNRFLSQQMGDEFIISIQNPIVLNDSSEPEPDISVLRFKEDYYESGHPEPQDTFLLVEVAESSFETDNGVKLALYAQAAIPEVWIVDLKQNRVLVYQQPNQGEYRRMATFTREEQLETSLSLSVSAKDILG